MDYRNMTKDGLTPIKKDSLNLRRSSNNHPGNKAGGSTLPASLLLNAVNAPIQGTKNLN
jgi:hypothetical protein